VKLEPLPPSAHFNLAWALAKKGQLDEAIVQYQMAVKFDPAYLEAYNNLGTLYIEKGRWDDAVKQFQHALEIKPEDPDLQENLERARASVRQKSGNH